MALILYDLAGAETDRTVQPLLLACTPRACAQRATSGNHTLGLYR